MCGTRSRQRSPSRRRTKSHKERRYVVFVTPLRPRSARVPVFLVWADAVWCCVWIGVDGQCEKNVRLRAIHQGVCHVSAQRGPAGGRAGRPCAGHRSRAGGRRVLEGEGEREKEVRSVLASSLLRSDDLRDIPPILHNRTSCLRKGDYVQSQILVCAYPKPVHCLWILGKRPEGEGPSETIVHTAGCSAFSGETIAGSSLDGNVHRCLALW